MTEIKFERAAALKAKPQDESKLGFGSIFTDYMFVMEYTEGRGWHDPVIKPYGTRPPCACTTGRRSLRG